MTPENFHAGLRVFLVGRRKTLNISQRELARLSGLSQSNLCQLESGIRTPSWTTARLWAAALDLTIDIRLIRNRDLFAPDTSPAQLAARHVEPAPPCTKCGRTEFRQKNPDTGKWQCSGWAASFNNPQRCSLVARPKPKRARIIPPDAQQG